MWFPVPFGGGHAGVQLGCSVVIGAAGDFIQKVIQPIGRRLRLCPCPNEHRPYGAGENGEVSVMVSGIISREAQDAFQRPFHGLEMLAQVWQVFGLWQVCVLLN